MVMENKHMVDGDGVDDDGDEEPLKIPFFGMENKINQTPKMKIMMVAALRFTKRFVLLGGIGFVGI
jgi:hypothetical protein